MTIVPYNVLVIEDNQGDYELIADYFSEVFPGTEIVHVKNFEKAKIQIPSQNWTCIFLDLTLPDLSGLDLVNQVLELANSIPVIVLTGYSNFEFGVQALSLGVSDYLIKDELTAYQLMKSIRYSIERKRINDQLIFSELKYRNLFFTSPAPLWVFDTSTYKFLDVNQAAIRLYGYSKEEFLKMTIRDIRPFSELEKLDFILKSNRGSKVQFHGQCTHQKKNGEILQVELQSNLIDFDNEPARLVQVIDITEKLRIQQEIINSERRFKALVQEGSDYIAILNERDEFSYISPNAASALGYKDNQFKGKDTFDLIHPDDIERVKHCFKRVEIERKVAIDSFRIKAADGSWHWFETILTNMLDDPAVKGIISNNRDVTERHAYEETIRKQGNLFRALIEKSPNMKALITLEGDIVFGTPSITKILGYSPEDYLGKNERDFVHPDDIEMLMKLIESIVSSEDKASKTIELRIKHKEGHYLWCDKIITNMLSDPDIKAIICNFWDITDIKKTQLKIQESNERYDRVADATSDVIWDLDLRNQHIAWNKGMEKLFGYSLIDEKDALVFWKSIIHPDDRERVEIRFEKNLAAQNSTWEDEYRVLCKNGKYKYVFDRGFLVRNGQGESTRMVGAIQDITRQKEEENRLRILESVITHTHDSVLITDADPIDIDGPKIIYVNEAFIQMTGYSREEMIGQTPRMFQCNNTSRAGLNEIRHALENKISCEVELINARKNGQQFWVNIAISPVFDMSGTHLTHFIAIEKEITERKIQEQDRELLIQELTKNNNDLRQFSYITSHNLRAPLSNLIGILDLIDEMKIKDPIISRLMKGFQVSTNQLNDTINDLIRILIVKDNPSMELVQLNFSDIMESVQNLIQNDITLIKPEIHIDFSKINNVKFNRPYLESILLNLFTNSLKYRSLERPLQISIYTEPTENGGVILHFSDNGLGFDLTRLKDRMFGLYQRFHKHPDSKGMGLYLVKSQLEALGGKIDVESSVDCGTRFTLKFK